MKGQSARPGKTQVAVTIMITIFMALITAGVIYMVNRLVSDRKPIPIVRQPATYEMIDGYEGAPDVKGIIEEQRAIAYITLEPVYVSGRLDGVGFTPETRTAILYISKIEPGDEIYEEQSEYVGDKSSYAIGGKTRFQKITVPLEYAADNVEIVISDTQTK